MMSPSIFISCTSTTPATGELAETSLPADCAVRVMKAPEAFWPCTVARAHAFCTSTVCATAPAEAKEKALATKAAEVQRMNVMG